MSTALSAARRLVFRDKSEDRCKALPDYPEPVHAGAKPVLRHCDC